MRSICKNHPLAPQQRQAILNTQTILIDNNAVYVDHTDKLLLCPDYGYCVFENLLNVIPKEARNHPAIQQLMYGLINSGYLCSVGTREEHSSHVADETAPIEDGMKTLTKQYFWLATKCKDLCRKNAMYMHDDFWKYLRRMIVNNKVQIFSSSIIKQLQDASWKHAKHRHVKE